MTKSNLDNLIYLQLLLNVDGIGTQKIFELLSHLHTSENIIRASYDELICVNGITKTLANKILTSTSGLDSVKSAFDKELNKLDKIKAKIITYWDKNYPELLKHIYYPPLIIYTIGDFTDDDKYSLAIVGTRIPTSYGKFQAEKFAKELVEKKITVVSGLARGIDTVAHQSAIKNNGRTVAVIGSGLDVFYPPENRKLFEKITENGVVISEYKLGAKPDAQNFPKRNRIISGLSLGVLVVETKINGGAMHTANYAIDQNREIFAIPGNINVAQSEGTNTLIQRGTAKLVMNAEDILLELELKLKPEVGKNIPRPTEDLNLFEEKLLNILDNDSKYIDEIALAALMTTSDCLVNLLTLEFKGLVKQLPGKVFMRC